MVCSSSISFFLYICSSHRYFLFLPSLFSSISTFSFPPNSVSLYLSCSSSTFPTSSPLSYSSSFPLSPSLNTFSSISSQPFLLPPLLISSHPHPPSRPPITTHTSNSCRWTGSRSWTRSTTLPWTCTVKTTSPRPCLPKLRCWGRDALGEYHLEGWEQGKEGQRRTGYGNRRGRRRARKGRVDKG